CLCLPASRYYAVFKVLAGYYPAVLLVQARLLEQFFEFAIACVTICMFALSLFESNNRFDCLPNHNYIWLLACAISIEPIYSLKANYFSSTDLGMSFQCSVISYQLPVFLLTVYWSLLTEKWVSLK
uniref:hypothetical protein n=1 Tax=Scytonema sp. PCC 10023 TaxID=1680591 RepID=UPI0039C72AB0